MTRVDHRSSFQAAVADLVRGRDAERAVPLTREQRRLWLLSSMSPDFRAGVVARYAVTGDLDPAEIQLRLGACVTAHEALRSTFAAVGSSPVRIVRRTGELDVDVVDLRAADGGVDEVAARMTSLPWPVETGPLLRAAVVLLAAGRTEIVLAGSRLVLDDTSLDLVAAQLLRPGPTTGSLTAAVEAERERTADPRVADPLRALARRLTAPAVRTVRGHRARPAVKGHRRAIVRRTAAPELFDAPDPLARIGAVWSATLCRWEAADAAVCGVRTPHRRRDDAAAVVGPLDEPRPVRVDPGAGVTLAGLAAEVRAALAALPDVPFAHLVEQHPPDRDVSRTPYFGTEVRLVDTRILVAADDRTVRRLPVDVATTEYDLRLSVWLEPSGATVELEYDTDVFTGTEADGLLGCVLEIAGQPDDVAVEDIGLLSARDTGAVLDAGAGRPTEADPRSLVDLIGAQVARTPSALAVHGPDQLLTYAELWERSEAVARGLVADGVRPGDVVGTRVGRRADAIVALVGILRCGAAFLCVDPSYPAERTALLLHDAGSPLLLTDDDQGDAPTAVTARTLGAAARRGADAPGELPPVSGSAAAYLVYTSGSTGRPKGVVVSHTAAVNNLHWRQRLWRLTPSDRVLHNHPFTFDPSVWATFWPLAYGARIVLAAGTQLADPAALIDLVAERGVTVLGGVPSLLSALADHPAAGGCTRVRLVLSGGEPFTPELFDAITGVWSAAVANLYGPTEATIDATAGPVVSRGADEPAPIPIGLPVDGTAVRVVDPQLRPLPFGAVGEIVVGGAGVAAGYRGRPGLTAARFLPDPHATGARLYRTGDLGRQLPDGSLQFLGRVDDQVKIRGHRIELAEVEAALATITGVREAAVTAIRAGTETAQLAAAVVVTDATAARAVRAGLADVLPRHLVPDVVEVRDELPRTVTGKIDRPRLARELTRDGAAPRTSGRAPSTALERSVAEAFAQVLPVDAVDAETDFFAVGGTSIMIARLSVLLARRHDVEIPLHEFFHEPTPAGVAAVIGIYREQGIAGVLGRRHSAVLEADAVLDERLRPDGLVPADWSDPSRILLTGATGYLGLHLLEQLLLRTDAEIVCLCRARDDEHARQRILSGFAEYEITVPDHLLSRVRCVVGDLGSELLGLSEQTWRELATGVDVIYHNGAMVNFVYPYSTLREPNVQGTVRVLELACTGRLKAVHHVSTIDTLLATHTPRPFLEDDRPLQSATNVPMGYTGSKWVAEKIMNEARARGIPVTIFRPGLILGHTRTGATQTIDYLLVALRGFLPMGIVPDYPRILDVVTVDYVAAAIAHVSLAPGALGGIYHLFNPRPVSLATFCGWIADFGYDFDLVPFEEGRRRALEVAPDHPLYPLLPLIRDAEAEPHRALDPCHLHELEPGLECARTLDLLSGSGIACQPVSREQAHALVDYLIRVGFLPAPDAITDLQEVAR